MIFKSENGVALLIFLPSHITPMVLQHGRYLDLCIYLAGNYKLLIISYRNQF